MMHNRLCRAVGLSALTLGLLLATLPAQAQTTIEMVRKRGQLSCGVSQGLVGFSANEPDRGWRGFDVDFCRAVASAVLGDGSKIEFVPLDAKQRFGALEDGRIDLLSRNTTWTMGRDVLGNMDFVGISYFDGQGFMVPVAAGLSSALQLENAKICILKGTTTAEHARDFFARQKLKVELVFHDSRAAALTDYARGKCDAYSADLSALASQRSTMAKPGEHMLLPEVISKEPLGPVVRQSDPKWRELVQWVLYLLINAEENNWSKMNAADKSKVEAIVVPPQISARLGLRSEWPRQVIAAVGHYGEIFDRNLGAGSKLKIDRGVNALWTRGGILYAPPIR